MLHSMDTTYEMCLKLEQLQDMVKNAFDFERRWKPLASVETIVHLSTIFLGTAGHESLSCLLFDPPFQLVLKQPVRAIA